MNSTDNTEIDWETQGPTHKDTIINMKHTDCITSHNEYTFNLGSTNCLTTICRALFLCWIVDKPLKHYNYTLFHNLSTNYSQHSPPHKNK